MDAKMSTGRKRKAAETKDKIYKSASSLYKKYGFENVSVDAIVNEAGISKGAFYLHFSSKDALTAALIMEYVSKLDLSYRAFMENFPNDASARDVLLSLVGRIADAITNDVGYCLIRIVYRLQIDRNSETDALLSYKREIYAVFSSLIRRGIQQGEFASGFDADIVAEQSITILRGFTYEWCIRYPDFQLKEQLLRHFNLLFSGIEKQ